MPKFVSLFSGIGGFDLGFERAGMQCVAQIEIDSQARDVLSRHFPDVPKFKDVTDVGHHNLPAADVVCGGFPCQDVSIAGRRAGLVGERSGLWFEFHRVLTELKPKWVVIENVPGLLSSNGGRDFATVLRGLVNIGYRVVWRVLDAQYFGVPQRRRRLFIVGHLGDGRAAHVLFEREGVSRDTPPRRAARDGIARAVAGSLAASGAGTMRPAGQKNELDFIVANYQQFGKWKTARVTGTLQAANGKRADILAFGAQNAAAQGLSVGTIAPTLSTTKIPAVTVPQLRRLTPTECERLQGFPDGWTSGQSDTVRYRQCGNAVAVPVAEWIARRIIADNQSD